MDWINLLQDKGRVTVCENGNEISGVRKYKILY